MFPAASLDCSLVRSLFDCTTSTQQEELDFSLCQGPSMESVVDAIIKELSSRFETDVLPLLRERTRNFLLSRPSPLAIAGMIKTLRNKFLTDLDGQEGEAR